MQRTRFVLCRQQWNVYVTPSHQCWHGIGIRALCCARCTINSIQIFNGCFDLNLLVHNFATQISLTSTRSLLSVACFFMLQFVRGFTSCRCCANAYLFGQQSAGQRVISVSHTVACLYTYTAHNNTFFWDWNRVCIALALSQLFTIPCYSERYDCTFTLTQLPHNIEFIFNWHCVFQEIFLFFVLSWNSVAAILQRENMVPSNEIAKPQRFFFCEFRLKRKIEILFLIQIMLCSMYGFSLSKMTVKPMLNFGTLFFSFKRFFFRNLLLMLEAYYSMCATSVWHP